MKKELEQKLFKKYARFFAHRKEGSLEGSLMGFGFDHGDGWFPLVETLLSEIARSAKRWNEVRKTKKRLVKKGITAIRWIDEYFEQYPTDPFEDFEILQVKEKFGGLRFYYEGGTEEVHGMVNLAEQLSFRICEICGAPGRMTVRRGWWRTLCKKCFRKQGEGDYGQVSEG